MSLSAQTVLQPGDLVVLGVNASNGACGGENGEDLISFVVFKDILPNTIIDLTDNGYERLNPGLWGNSEGFVRAERTGDTISAGTVITFKLPGVGGDYEALGPDSDWTFTPQNTPPNTINLNNGGDQLFFLQGGTWDEGSSVGFNGYSHDAAYPGGRILFGFSTTTTWEAFQDDPQQSGLPPEISSCFNMSPMALNSDFISYVGPVEGAPQLEWISRIAAPANWQSYGSCLSYQFPPLQIQIDSSNISLSCTVCQSCGPTRETLFFNLPEAGGPFTVEYLVGTDTMQMVDVENGDSVSFQIDTTTRFAIISVADNTGCPTFSSFAEGIRTEIFSEVFPNTPDTLLACADPDGRGTFDLTTADAQIRGAEQATVRWFLDSTRTMPIPNPASFNSPGGTVYAALDNGACMSNTVAAPLRVLPGVDVELSFSTAPCDTACRDLIFLFSGQGPFHLAYRYSYQDSLAIDTLRSNNTSTVLPFCPGDVPSPGQPVSLELISLRTDLCQLQLDTSYQIYQGGPGFSEFRPQLCAGESIEVNGRTYDENRPTGTEILLGAARNGCDSIIQVELSFIGNLTADMTGPAGICPGETAALTFNLQGAETYTLELSDGSNTPIILNNVRDGDQYEVNPTETTTYTLLSVRGDSADCATMPNAELTIVVSDFQASLKPASDYNGFEVSCADASDGSLRASVAGTGGPFRLRWSTGDSTQQIDNLPPGVYDLEVATADGGCRQNLSYELRAPEPLTYSLRLDSAICADEPSRLIIQSISGGVQPYEYSLDEAFYTGITELPLIRNNIEAGTYAFSIQDLNDCRTGQTFTVGNASGRSLDLGPDQTIQSGDSLVLSATLNFEPTDFQWANTEAGTFLGPLEVRVKPELTTAYTLQVTSPEGCTLTDVVTVFVERRRNRYYAPTAFTPDEDGFNDTFTLYAGGQVRQFDYLRIFNRWGVLVYQAENLAPNDELRGWDGQYQGSLAPGGTYIYSALARYTDGTAEVVNGDFLLLR